MWAKIQAWLRAHLTNTWMNNMDYGWFMAHSGWAGLILLAIALLTSAHISWMAYATIGGVAAAALKEYWYDATYELPKQSSLDNTEDFLGYCAGMAVGWAVTGIGILTHLITAR